MESVLYVFSGEKAQGAEIVIERLMRYNTKVSAHLFIAPGDFSHSLLKTDTSYKITTVPELRRLFRSKANGFSFYLKAIKNHFRVSYKVYRYLKNENINVIHANNIVAASYLLPVLVFSKLFLRKKIWIWSDHDMSYTSKIDKAISTLAVRLYDRTLTVSDAVSKKYKEASKVQVLYNGLDTELFKPDPLIRNRFRTGLNLPADAILIGMAGKITPGKGHLGLIEVFSLMTKDFPDAYLVLAGDFAEDHPLYINKVMSAMAADKHIIYLGFLNDITPYYNGCDIIISNSDKEMSESLGTTIYEAMAFEKIVIASNTGGTPEIISDIADGFLFEAEEGKALYEKLNYIITNHELFGHIKAMARKKVMRVFNISNMTKEYNRIINTLQVLKA